MLQRFLLFAGTKYYPNGGWEDFQSAFEEQQAAVDEGHRLVDETYMSWWHVVDTLGATISRSSV